MSTILLVDDETGVRKALAMLLRDRGHEVTAVGSGEDAVRLAKESVLIDVMLLDVSLPGMSGLDVLKTLQDVGSLPPCVVMTAHGSIRSAVDAMRAGAFDYLTKPFDNDQLLIAVERAAAHRRLRSEVDSLRSELETRYGLNDILGISPPMQEVFRIVTRVCTTDATVMISGESGTGKELIARAIHRRSRRSAGPFVAVNCGAIPSSLVEAEFFGFERGAFTDAKETRAGKFEQAHQGTLFLDEIGDLPLEAQTKLLRVLQERQVTRLGSQRSNPVDVRVLAATNRDLEAAMARGEFRSDLYYRLNVVNLMLPPLRERGQDLELLLDHLLQRLSAEFGMPGTTLSPESRRLLLTHDWPGNVRELENCLRSALLLLEGPVLRAIDLPPRVRRDSPAGGSDANSPGETMSLARATEHAVERVERGYIRAALSEQRGNRTLAAQALGINRRTLFTKMRDYGLTTDADDRD